MKMNCVRVSEVGRFKWARQEIETPGDQEALIKVEVTGLCRTDLKLIRHGHRDLVLPRIPGEEVVGRIVLPGAAAAGFIEGDRVYVYPGMWCGDCGPCRGGAENLCRGMKIMGFHRDGGFAEYVVAPAQSLIKVPEGLSPDVAVMAEPLSCCLNALELGQVQPGTTVGIWGGGPAGILLARAAKAMGADAAVIEPDERRRAFIHGYAVCPDRRFDICIVAVGSRQAYQEALMHMAPRGRLVVFSGLLPAEDLVSLSFNQFHYHEQGLVGAYGCAYRHGVKALNWLADGTVPVEDMISHRLPLEELERALQLVENRESVKILLYPSLSKEVSHGDR